MGKNPLFGTRKKLQNGTLGAYEWKSYIEVYRQVTNIAKACQSLDLCANIEAEGRKFKTLGIYLRTREEWLISWISSWYLSGCVIPLYDTLGEESIEWIVKQTELKTIITTTPYNLKLAKLKLEGKLTTLKNVISVDDPKEDEIKQVINSGLKFYGFNEIIKIGESSKEELKPQVFNF